MVQEGRRPRVVEISTPGQEHYDEGLYTLSAQSFRPDKYERLETAFPTLTPLEEALKLGEKQSKAWKVRNPVWGLASFDPLPRMLSRRNCMAIHAELYGTLSAYRH